MLVGVPVQRKRKHVREQRMHREFMGYKGGPYGCSGTPLSWNQIRPVHATPYFSPCM